MSATCVCWHAPAVGVAAIWLAYGLFLGCSHIIFMMGACVVVTCLVFFVSELLSMVRVSNALVASGC